jgi:hypothetical protein
MVKLAVRREFPRWVLKLDFDVEGLGLVPVLVPVLVLGPGLVVTAVTGSRLIQVPRRRSSGLHPHSKMTLLCLVVDVNAQEHLVGRYARLLELAESGQHESNGTTSITHISLKQWHYSVVRASLSKCILIYK